MNRNYFSAKSLFFRCFAFLLASLCWLATTASAQNIVPAGLHSQSFSQGGTPTLVATPVGLLYAANSVAEAAGPSSWVADQDAATQPPASTPVTSHCLDANSPASRRGFELLHGVRAEAKDVAPASGRSVDREGLIEVKAGDDVCPLSATEKFQHFARDLVSPVTFLGAAAAAGVSQATNSDPAFEQGGEGYARRFGAAVADSASRRFFVDFLFPSVLHEDPRYFRKVDGGAGRRLGYAVSRLLVTRRDSGARSFNFSEVLGTLASAGLSNAYLRERERTGSKTMQRAGISFGVDAGYNLLREFLPDVWRKIHSGQ